MERRIWLPVCRNFHDCYRVASRSESHKSARKRATRSVVPPLTSETSGARISTFACKRERAASAATSCYSAILCSDYYGVWASFFTPKLVVLSFNLLQPLFRWLVMVSRRIGKAPLVVSAHGRCTWGWVFACYRTGGRPHRSHSFWPRSGLLPKAWVGALTDRSSLLAAGKNYFRGTARLSAVWSSRESIFG